MVLTEDQVREKAAADVDEWIEVARKDAKKLRLHYYGENTTKALTKIQGLESADQIKLRRDHAVPNTFLSENLLQPINFIWSAKGGTDMVKASTDSLTEQVNKVLDNVRGGMDVQGYFKNIWKDNYIADPNGLLFVEVDQDGNAYNTQKSIDFIKNMKVDGVRPEYVVFEPDVTIEEKDEPNKQTNKIPGSTQANSAKKLLWVVDDAFYYRVEVRGRTATILEERPNFFGQVPGVQNSPIVDTRRKIKVSLIWKQVDLLDKYLTNNSVKEIYQFLHGYPVFWSYIMMDKCKSCNGEGVISGKDCETCHGMGKVVKKDVSDGIALRPPETNDNPTIAPDVAGYVQPDLETWREQRTELDWTWDLLHFSVWGAVKEKTDSSRETATGRFIDAQPVNNKLNSVSDDVELIMSRNVDLFGIHVAGESYEGSSITVGRRFLIETPDQVWEKYLKAKKDQANIDSLDQLLEQYYESEYQRNDMLFMYYRKLMDVEPWIHFTSDQVQNLQGVTQFEKLRKFYYSDWKKTVSIVEVIETDAEKLRQKLSDYTTTKIEENGNQTGAGQPPGQNNGVPLPAAQN